MLGEMESYGGWAAGSPEACPWRLSKPTYRSHLNRGARGVRSRHSRRRRIFHCYRSNVGVSHEIRGVLARARARERGIEIERGERERERGTRRDDR